MKIDLKQLEEEKEKNKKERLDFVGFWANYVKNNKDEKWSQRQKMFINSQLKRARMILQSKSM
jgi:hypothetical protein